MNAKDRATSQELCTGASGNISRLLEIMRRLRDPETGCKWDIEQDFNTIAPYTLEEAYEVNDAINQQDWPGLESELGDLLLQSVYHCQIAAERGLFDFHDVVRAISDKMVRRHPHVFGDAEQTDSKQQVKNWEAEKAKERGTAGVLDGVALALPALMRSTKLQKRAARVGFDWDRADSVLDKVTEEAGELRAAIVSKDDDAVAEEFGDLLFSMVNYSRHLGIDAESALRKATEKFELRFRFMEKSLWEDEIEISTADQATLDTYWRKAKSQVI